MIRTLLSIALLGTTVMQVQAQSRILGMGQNNYHQLGNATAANPQTTPVLLQETSPSALSWTFLSSGVTSNLALREDGSLWAWGRNNDGQLGNNTTTMMQVPGLVSEGDGIHGRWVMVDIGGNHSLGIREDGSLWAWGSGTYGKLGLGLPYDDILYPMLVDSGTGPHGKWIAADAGLSHSLGLREDGSLWTWGNNANGQLGLGSDTIGVRDRPVLADSGNNWGGKILYISATANHSLAVKENGSLWAWGWNQYKQVGNGNTALKVFRISCVDSAINGGWLQVSAGYYHNIALRADSTLWAWGRSNNYQLGNGSTGTQAYMLMVDSGTSGNHGKWIKIKAGQNFNLGIRADSSFWAWGQNSNGQLGDGTTVNIPVITHIPALDGLVDPLISAGQAHTLILERLPATDTTDMEVYGLQVSGTVTAGAAHTVALTLRNSGTVPLVDPVAVLAVDHNVVVSDTLFGILAPGTFHAHVFSAAWVPAAEGAYSLCGYVVKQINDTLPANDTACQAISVTGATGIAIPVKPVCRLYPNPATDRLMLETDGSSIKGLQLMDSRGNIIKHFKPEHSGLRYAFDIKGLVPAAYWLRVQLDGRQATLMKFIKQ